MSPVRVLLRAKVRTLVNYRKSAEGGRGRFVGFVVLGAFVWLAIAATAWWFCQRVVAIEPIGVVMLRRLVELVLLFMLSILTVSNLIAAFSTLFLADDLPGLVARPVPVYALYTARWIENAAYASWMTVGFSAPFFLAAGLAMHGPWSYYATLALVLPVLATIPASIAIIIALVLARFLSAGRTRQILILVATIVFTVVFVLFRGLEPERFVDPDQRAPLLEVLGSVQGGDTPWLPSTWAADALWQPLSPLLDAPGHPRLLLVTAAAALFFVAGWTFRGLFFAAFSRAQDGVGRSEHAPAPMTTRAPARRAKALASSRRAGPFAALARKDLRVFARDTAQWTQMLLIGALVAIYVVNFSYIKSAGESGILSATALHFINLSLGGFVAVAVCVRFAFPAISLEGRAFWIVLRSPIRMIDLLRGKWIALAAPLTVLVAALVGVTSVWLGSGPLLTGLAALTVVPLVIGMTGLALGLGARFPRFGIDNAAKIATGFGGVVYMLVGLTILVVDVLLAVPPTLAVARVIVHQVWPAPGSLALTIGAGVLAVILPLAAGAIAVRRGAAHLQRAGIDA